MFPPINSRCTLSEQVLIVSTADALEKPYGAGGFTALLLPCPALYECLSSDTLRLCKRLKLLDSRAQRSCMIPVQVIYCRLQHGKTVVM